MALSPNEAVNSATLFQCSETPLRNFFGFEQYECATSFFNDTSVLSVGVGYGIVLGFGLVFGAFTVGLVYLERYLAGTPMNSESFNTAGRNIKIGLTASVIVSQWTWAATLLQSSNVAFNYGIAGPFWYASGATIQILLFSMLAVLVKRRAPKAHTFLEIIRARWGTSAHIVFTVFAFLTNVIVTSMLILGGSATVGALTGMNVDVASFLIPLGVILYTMAGGLKATFIASYFNTAVILIALCIFMFQVYATSPDLGSPNKVWENLQQVAKLPGGGVEGNRDNSYLTMFSRNGLFFGLTNIVGNFGTVFVDQAYWQSAIAATPSASWKGYLLGGLCWFAIPFSLATALGLASVALSLPISEIEAGSGLVPPAVATHLMGSGGSVLILIMLFMAVTSTGAAEQIAVSSLFAYDIYRTYLNPNATGKQIIFVSRLIIVIFGLLMGVLGIALNHIGINLGWLYLFMGVVIGSAVAPVAFSISWTKCSGVGAISGAVGGLILALTTWLLYGGLDGGISIKNLQRDEIMLTGNLVAILSSALICIVVSYANPDKCDWTSTRAIALIEDDPNAELTEEDEAKLERASKLISLWGLGVTVVLIIAWPLLAMIPGVFSKGYFTFWVVISFIWGIMATGAMLILPVWESRDVLLKVVKGRNSDGDEVDPVETEGITAT